MASPRSVIYKNQGDVQPADTNAIVQRPLGNNSALPPLSPAGKKITTTSSDDASDYEAKCFDKYERRNFNINYGGERWGVRINPVSFFTSVILIWSFAIWCMVRGTEASAKLGDVQRYITDIFTWIYMLTQQVWVVFLLVLYVSRLGKLKLGKPNDDPEYPTASWFMMMFSAGIGIGLFFFGVAEPVWHYEPCYPGTTDDAGNHNPFAGEAGECKGNRYAFENDDDRAQWAMNLTYFHWGIHAWVAYCVVGLLLGAVAYRKNLPMTMKSAFYPVIGDKIFGWMGDAIDTVSVATTLFGVCTSLGLGVIQLNAGINRVNSSIPQNNGVRAGIIWGVTALATISVVTGVKVGIRRLSEINWLLAQFIAFVFFFQENTWYLLNVLVQSIGFYFQWIIELGTWCNAFENSPAKTFNEGTEDVMHVTAIAPDGKGTDRGFMNAWTIFYWGWWIAWAPFVGIFIAKISRGRTVRNIINGAMTGPVLYGFFWFATFGGIGLRIERQAANLGVQCDIGGTIDANGVHHPYVEVDGRQFWRLSCGSEDSMWFDMITNFPMHRFYWVLSIISLVLYFVTSSDSGSLVIDSLTSNGNPHPPVFQRVFWSATEGAVAMALLLAGGKDGLSALRSVSIIAGVPYTVVVCIMCMSLWTILSDEYDLEYGIVPHKYADWRTGVIDVLDYPTFSIQQLIKTLAAIFIPGYYGGLGAAWVCEQSRVIWQAVYSVLFYGWILFLAVNPVQRGLWAIGWVLYVAYALHQAYIRCAMRSARNIRGSIGTDIILSMIFYPFVAVQLHDEALAAEEEKVAIKADSL